MNSINLIGNLTKDPDIRYSQSGTAVASFSIAINRGKNQQGEDMGADYPRINAFGKTAENCGKYLRKGSKVAVNGRIQTGSYKKSTGETVYTTDVVASRIEFLTSKGEQGNGFVRPEAQGNIDVPDGFEAIDDDDIPF